MRPTTEQMARSVAAGVLVCLLFSEPGDAAPEVAGSRNSLLTASCLLAAEETISQKQSNLGNDEVVDSIYSESDTAVATILIVDSNPDSANILVDGKSSEVTTPYSFSLADTVSLVEVVKTGYEPLAEKIPLSPGERVIATYLLKAFPPDPITPAELGFEPVPQQPLLDEKAADRLESKFLGLSFTFAIVPFGQGVLAKALLDDDDKGLGDALMISGAVLSAGSYALGKILSSKKRSDIKRKNEIIKIENEAAKEQNREIDKAVKTAYDEAVELWLMENADKGRVVLERE
jgi:hypothetical protein